MTIAEWLETRTPPPPPALAARLQRALAPVLEHEIGSPGGAAHAEMLAAAEGLLRVALHGGTPGRETAHDLLAADALVTYAFELAAEDPGVVDALTDSAMRRLGALAAEDFS